MIPIIVALVAGAIGAGLGYSMKRRAATDERRLGELYAAEVRASADAERKAILLEAKEDAIRTLASAEEDGRQLRLEVQAQERRLRQKEENLDRKAEDIENRQRRLQQREEATDLRLREVETLRLEQVAAIEHVSSLTRDEARLLLLQRVEEEVRTEAGRRARVIEMDARATAETQARKILALAIQRYSSDTVGEITTTVVPIPNEEMKGRIIGREGRNIRALEAATGVDLIIDDTPDAVTLSCFDPVRREIARLALTKLVQDGRIHPARIEEIVAKSKQEIEQEIREEGEAASYEAGVPGLHPEIIKVVGRLKFRTSYGQNQLQHAVEAAHIGAMLAAEVGADVNVVRRASFLHDIGKVLTHEVEGPHHIIGADFIRRFGEAKPVVQAVMGHHDADPDRQAVEDVLVQAADAASGARPGARRESVENYVRRLEALEEVANSFDGVEKSFAIQAGREVRIIVKPEVIDDLQAMRLARDIVKKIEETLQYPGQVKVTVVRETRAVDYAR
ncbi:MAG TPA: ribonuclease Y [Chloroflexota bacterium]|jgi:ribonuclease Y|nr:ribonuclease Y [Chloroflexota bacterium]